MCWKILVKIYKVAGLNDSCDEKLIDIINRDLFLKKEGEIIPNANTRVEAPFVFHFGFLSSSLFFRYWLLKLLYLRYGQIQFTEFKLKLYTSFLF